MYEASRDGLFRTRRDAGNNPDFEETRKVFASKMTKIHMQKQQEEMAKNNMAIKINGGHNSNYYTKDRPPINSYRQPGEAAAKPPILSGPVPGTTAGNQHAQFDGQKHLTGIQSEPPASRAFGYGNNYDNKERLEPHSYQHSSPGNTSHHQSPTLSGSDSSISSQQPQRQPATPTVNTFPPQQNQAVTRSPPSSAGPAKGWSGDAFRSAKPDLIPTLPLSAFTGGADLHKQQQQQPSAYYAPSSPTSKPSANHNGPVAASSPLPETPQPEVHEASAKLIPGNVAKSSNKVHSQSQGPSFGQASNATTAQVPCPTKPVQLACQSLPSQPQEQGPSAAEIKLEALTKRLEKELDAQPKADYFGKTV